MNGVQWHGVAPEFAFHLDEVFMLDRRRRATLNDGAIYGVVAVVTGVAAYRIERLRKILAAASGLGICLGVNELRRRHKIAEERRTLISPPNFQPPVKRKDGVTRYDEVKLTDKILQATTNAFHKLLVHEAATRNANLKQLVNKCTGRGVPPLTETLARAKVYVFGGGRLPTEKLAPNSWQLTPDVERLVIACWPQSNQPPENELYEMMMLKLRNPERVIILRQPPLPEETDGPFGGTTDHAKIYNQLNQLLCNTYFCKAPLENAVVETDKERRCLVTSTDRENSARYDHLPEYQLPEPDWCLTHFEMDSRVTSKWGPTSSAHTLLFWSPKPFDPSYD